MLRHRVIGKSKLSKEEINTAVELFCEEMFPRWLHKDSFLVIKSTEPNDTDLFSASHLYGFMYARDTKSKAHKRFSIWINARSSKKQQLITLFHELVHVKQARLGHLKFRGMFMERWCSRSIDEFKSEPWEKDPIKYENKLYKKYMERTCKRKRSSGRSRKLTKQAT